MSQSEWPCEVEAMIRSCQKDVKNFLRYISNGEVHTCNTVKLKVAHNLIGLPFLFYKQFVHKSFTYTCTVLFESTVTAVSVLL